MYTWKVLWHVKTSHTHGTVIVVVCLYVCVFLLTSFLEICDYYEYQTWRYEEGALVLGTEYYLTSISIVLLNMLYIYFYCRSYSA